MILLEKLLFLKTISLFQFTPDDLLKKIAQTLCKETMVCAEETVIEKGKTDTSIYLIISGEMKVHDGAHTVKVLGEREIFGEFAAFVQTPRTASVTALRDSILLKVNSSGLYELMNFDTGLTRGVIRALCLRNIQMAEQIQSLIQVITPRVHDEK